MINHKTQQRVTELLNKEAEYLDRGELHNWLELLTEDLEYRMPRRVTRERNAERSEFSDEGFYFKEDKGTLSTRVERFDREYAWAENPPSRTRRFVSNIRISKREGDEFDVVNNILIYRNQGDTTEADILSAERFDVIREADGRLKIAERVIHLDQPIVGTRNLSFFL